MGTTGSTPWNVLSDMITRRVGEARQRKQKVEDEARQNQMNIIMAGIQARAQSGTLTDDEIKQAEDQMGKLVPKESIPLIQGWNKLMSVVGRRKKGQQGQPGQQPGQAQPAGGQPIGGPQGIGAAPTAPPAAVTAGVASAAGKAAGAVTQPAPSGAKSGVPTALQAIPKPGLFPSASELGKAAGEQQQAQEQVLMQSRQAAVDGLRKSYDARGQQMPKEMSEALDLWAIGAPTNAITAMSHYKLHPIVVKGPNNSRIPAIQNEITGEVIGPDGQVIPNPEIMPSSGAKPRVVYGKDEKGWFSFLVDPFTNQPIDGSEDRKGVPPSQYLDKVGTHQQIWFDDSGREHIESLQSRRGVQLPGGGAGGGAGTSTSTGAGTNKGQAVPPSMKRKAGAGTSTGTGVTGAGERDRTLTGRGKDTGVLSPQAQKIIQTTQPVIDQTQRLLDDIDKLGLKDNNKGGYLFWSRVKYGVGIASPEGTLASDIAALSMARVVDAASALQGSSRSLSALHEAMKHTPNPWADSPKQLYDKLSNIQNRLNDIVASANKYGHKRQQAADTTAVPKNMRTPPSGQQLTPDQEADQYLRSHGPI